MSFPAASAAVGFDNWLRCSGRVSFLSVGICIWPIIKAARQAFTRAQLVCAAGQRWNLVWDVKSGTFSQNEGHPAGLEQRGCFLQLPNGLSG